MREKFVENEMSCQFLSNCGQLIFILVICGLLKVTLIMLKNVVSDTGTLKSKTAITVTKINNYVNIEFFISIMDMFQLDFYLAIFLQLDSFEIRSSKSMINIAAAIIIFLVMVFIKIYLFFISTRVAIIRTEQNEMAKGYKKHYYNYLFLNEETDCENWYSKHQMIMNLVKDPFLAFFLVFFSRNGKM
jgi:ABC-type multidrug transport system fused ATPase/permease subunit